MNNNYLLSVRIDKTNNENFLFVLPIFKDGLKIEFNSPITFIIGENGTGKSTLLENIACKVGFNILGGNKNHLYDDLLNQDNTKLCDEMKLSWRLKTSKGFFFRAESFFNFSSYMEDMAMENGKSMFASYGGKSLKKQSHGESFLSLFKNKFQEGLFILDEPESALSVEKQLSLIAIIDRLAKNGCQFIIATHSPILITCPNSQIYEIENNQLLKKEYLETKQFQLYKNFVNCPDRYLNYLLNVDE